MNYQLKHKIDTTKEFKFKFLVYPNITYQKDLEKDSYVVVIRELIKALNHLRNDIHFTLILPNYVESLDLPNVEQSYYPMPTYPNSMRTHFDFTKMKEIVDWTHKDFDVLYSHLPEHTAQLSNLFCNTTDLSPMILGYCHWYEIKENTSYSKNMFLANIAGTLEMKECGVNSEWLKKLVIERAGKYFNAATIAELEKIIQPHYLGIENVYKKRAKVIKNSILFNHRPNDYTGWNWFIEILDELWQERKDFQLFTTLAEVERPYSKNISTNSRPEYLDFVKTMYLGVGAFEKYSSWSVAVTDGLSQGVPYLLPNKLCYPEMLGDKYPLFYKDREDFKKKLNELLDSTREVETTVKWLKPRLKEFLWQERVSHWFRDWKVLDELPTVKRSEGYERLLKFIKGKGSTTKSEILKHMKWGKDIAFSRYRNLLRLEPKIRLTKDSYRFIG